MPGIYAAVKTSDIDPHEWDVAQPSTVTWDPRRPRFGGSDFHGPHAPQWIYVGDAYQYTLLPALAALWARLRHHPLALAHCRNAWTAADPDHTLDLRIAFASGLLFMWPHSQNMNTSVNWDTWTLFRVPDAPFHDP